MDRSLARSAPGYPIVVVGGGAAGILAAWRAASRGAPVLLLEKNHRLGMKILISGGGKCNVTHEGEMNEIRSQFRSNEARFLKPSFYRFTNHDVIELLERRGIRLYSRPDGRIFPVDGTARDVVAALEAHLRAAGVSIRLGAAVSGIEFREIGPGAIRESQKPTDELHPAKEVAAVLLGTERIPTHHLILCVGGSSYPGTGTTGDGWPWVQAAGHSLVKIRAALAPLFLETPQPFSESQIPNWAGVALRDCMLRARQSGKVFASWRGDLLFTHRGVSGPCALGISREVAERRSAGPVTLEVDLAPSSPIEAIIAGLHQWLRQNPRRPTGAFVDSLVPARLAPAFLESAGCEPGLLAAYLPQKTRSRLAQQIKAWPIGSVQHVPLEKGEVVAGGVALDEVDPRTMRSRRAAGLYLCGEILDIAGPVGGYNLQAAWSTGCVAGESAAQDWMARAYNASSRRNA
ncbi:MAG TPA: aminoacetone oxidase family FAD-binding enzyme [Armatimonadota bacterium]|nr:aminoacetone oxidase family FAD-binding enzyme [Armatimonadota bacterium]